MQNPKSHNLWEININAWFQNFVILFKALRYWKCDKHNLYISGDNYTKNQHFHFRRLRGFFGIHPTQNWLICWCTPKTPISMPNCSNIWQISNPYQALQRSGKILSKANIERLKVHSPWPTSTSKTCFLSNITGMKDTAPLMPYVSYYHFEIQWDIFWFCGFWE